MCEPTEEILQLAAGPVGRSIHRDNRLYADLIAGAKPTWQVTKSRLIVGRGMRVPFDSARFEMPIQKMVRALFFHKSHVPLPASHDVYVCPDKFWQADGFAEIVEGMEPWQNLGDDVFRCRCLRDPRNAATTAWLFLFYGMVGIFASTLPIQPAHRLEESQE